MPELMITPTPTQPPAAAGNANALSQSEAPARSGDTARADTENGPPTPFASVLKSQMDKKATAKEAGDRAADSAATAQAEVPAITIAIDLSGLLPLLGITPDAGTMATAQAESASAQTGVTPGLPALPVLPALPAIPVLPGMQPMAATAAPEVPAAAIAGQAVAMDAGSRKLQAETGREPHASLATPKAEAAALMPGKPAPDAAINADPGSRNSEVLQQESPPGDFRALMERATNISPGTANSTNNAPSNPSLRIDTPFGQSGWHEEMGQKLTWMAGNNRQQADLVLTPPQLGRVEVSLTMNGDQATAIFTSPNPAVREALEASLQRLREVLADAGVSLGQTQVGSESPSQSSRQDERGVGTDRGVRYAATVALPGSSATARSGAGRGMVDVFA